MSALWFCNEGNNGIDDIQTFGTASFIPTNNGLMIFCAQDPSMDDALFILCMEENVEKGVSCCVKITFDVKQ